MLKNLILTVVFTSLLVYGCGYRMVITGKAASFKLYPAIVENSSDDFEMTSVFSEEVRINLSSINVLTDKDKADYIGEFTLEELNSTGSSTTSSTSTAYVRIKLLITIKNMKGESIFERKFSAMENYDNTPSMSETRTNREEAFRKTVNRAIMDFRNAFEQK